MHNLKKYNFQCITVEDYRKIDALSYSLLTSSNFKQSQIEPTKAMIFGSYVDDSLLLSDTSKYLIVDRSIDIIPKTTNSGKFIIELIKRNIDIEKENLLSDLYNELGIKRPSFNVFKADILDDSFIDIYYVYRDAKDKIIISFEDYNEAEKVIFELKTNQYVSKYFDKVSDGIIENLFQVPIIIKVKDNLILKSLLDIVHINHEEKTIRPMDLKTMEEDTETMFTKVFFKRKYYIQASLYRFLLEKYIHFTPLKDYKILPFAFIPISKYKFDLKPLVYEVGDEAHNLFLNGGEDKFGNQIKGVHNLIDDYLFITRYHFFLYSNLFATFLSK